MSMKDLAQMFDKIKADIAKECARRVCRHCEKGFDPPYKTKDGYWHESIRCKASRIWAEVVYDENLNT